MKGPKPPPVAAIQQRLDSVLSSRRTLARLGFVIGLVTSLGWCFLTPPYHAPDEPNHLFRIYQLSEGTLFAQKRDGQSGGWLPKSLGDLGPLWVQAIAFNPNKKFDFNGLKQGLAIPLHPKRRDFLYFSNTVVYPPGAYFPALTAITLGRWLEIRPAFLFYLGRISNALVSATLLWLTLLWLPIGANLLIYFLSFLPMTMLQRSSVSSDSFTFSLCFLLIAYCFKLMRQRKLERKDHIIFSVLSLLVGLAKQAYLLLPLLFWVIPSKAIGGGRKKTLYLSASLGLVALVVLVWAKLLSPHLSPIVPGSNLWAQLNHVVTHPLSTLSILWNVFYDGFFPWKLSGLVVTWVGRLGWLDTALPDWYWKTSALLAILTALSIPSPPQWTSRSRLFCFVLFVASAFFVELLIYLTGMKVGAANLVGVQGRYFIPVMPLFFFSLWGLHEKFLNQKIQYLALFWPLVSFIVMAEATFERFVGY